MCRKQPFSNVRWFTALLVAAAVIPSVVPTRGLCGPPSTATNPSDLKNKKLAVARQCLAAITESYRAGKAEVDSEKFCLWSRRVMEAQRDLSDKKADQRAAIEAHLERMKDLRILATEKYRAGQTTHADVLATEFFVAEAELWLGQVKKE